MRKVMFGFALVVFASSVNTQGSPVIDRHGQIQAPIVRTFAPDSVWRRIWIIGTDSTSDRFVEPRQIAVSGDLVVVLDLGTREVTGLDARTGASRFLLKPRGQGPGEFKRPARVAATPDGFAVLDHNNARLSAYDRNAKLQWDVVLGDVFSIDGLCIRNASRSGPRIAARHQRRDSSIVEYDTTGRRTAVRSVPWKTVPQGGSSFAYAGFMSDASPSGECVVAPLFGGEWAVATANGAMRAFSLKEPKPNAEVKVSARTLDRNLTTVTVQSSQQSNTEQASRGAMIRGDTAIINAADTKQSPLRVLDYYDARTGAYLYSRKLPFIVVSLAMGTDGTFYATRIGTEQQAVIAMRPEKPK